MHAETLRGMAVAGSFRDPAGFVFVRDGRLYRQINRSYEDAYRALVDSGLYRRLSADGLLIAHEEVSEPPLEPAMAARVIRPEPVPFVSYPHEWSFSQLRDAALLTLAVHKRALGHGMVLKDASAFNVQFLKGRPIHIDTLSFMTYREGEPWLAYRQFCEHFLAPLALCGMIDMRLGRMLSAHLDGLPLDLAAQMLPWRSLLKPGLALHVHLHARFQSRYQNSAASARRAHLSRNGMLALIDSLERAVAAVRPRARPTVWTAYDGCDSDPAYRAQKLQALQRCVDGRKLALVYDLGANVGAFSRAAASEHGLVVAADADAGVVDANYRACRDEGRGNLLPLVLDLANPSPGTGWENAERMPFLKRAQPDLVLALALVHHLAIGNNLPLSRVARMLRDLCRELVVEFVPETDPQALRLIAARRDQSHAYSREAFESAFGELFGAATTYPLSRTGRTLYHYRAT